MVYEAKVELPAADGRAEVMYRKLRGEAGNAQEAANAAGDLVNPGECVVAVKPLWNLDW